MYGQFDEVKVIKKLCEKKFPKNMYRVWSLRGC